VEEMKKLLADPQKQARTILSLAFDAGFNSKPAFNTIFKRFTGLTPTQYKKSFS
jgi:AraC-like DNA-binding protein